MRKKWSAYFHHCIELRLLTGVVFWPQEKSEASDAGSQAVEEDYDVDEEYDNDYADNYFDNGEGDDFDDLGGGGGDPSGGGTSDSFVGFQSTEWGSFAGFDYD